MPSQVNHWASFNRSTFNDWAIFDDSSFNYWASFEGSTFTGWASFNGSAFNGKASFCRSTFIGEAGFDGSSFNDLARFDGSTFAREAQNAYQKRFERSPFGSLPLEDNGLPNGARWDDDPAPSDDEIELEASPPEGDAPETDNS